MDAENEFRINQGWILYFVKANFVIIRDRKVFFNSFPLYLFDPAVCTLINLTNCLGRTNCAENCIQGIHWVNIYLLYKVAVFLTISNGWRLSLIHI